MSRTRTQYIVCTRTQYVLVHSTYSYTVRTFRLVVDTLQPVDATEAVDATGAILRRRHFDGDAKHVVCEGQFAAQTNHSRAVAGVVTSPVELILFVTTQRQLLQHSHTHTHDMMKRRNRWPCWAIHKIIRVHVQYMCIDVVYTGETRLIEFQL